MSLPPLRVWLGFGLVLLLHLLALAAAIGIASLAQDYLYIVFFLAGISLIQAVYVLPLLWQLKQHGQDELLKGALLAAGLTLLGGGLCWGTYVIGQLT